MKYMLAGIAFERKSDIAEHCRKIRDETQDYENVSEDHLPFLMALFKFHDEWEQKAEAGVLGITVMTADQGSRCFALIKQDETYIDIGFPHSIKLIPTARSGNRTPQGLLDFRNGARTAIEGQINEFRNSALAEQIFCEITGEGLHHGNSDVDHKQPDTFDSILFAFCKEEKVNPLEVAVGSLNGVVAVIENQSLLKAWQEWHEEHAQLRLISRTANQKLPKSKMNWKEMYE